jgi:hypothetical protein
MSLTTLSARRADARRRSLDSPREFGHTCLVSFAWSIADAEIYRAGDSVAWVWNPRARFLLTRVHGPGTLAALQLYTARAEREMLRGRLTVFHDWSGMHSYEPDARDELRRWGKLHNGAFDSVHYLVRSKVVAMLISVAALSLGRDLSATTDRPQFLADLDRALAGA